MLLEKIKKNIGGIIFLVIFSCIATCNVRMRNNDRLAITSNPEAGYYYVFDDYPVSGSESIMKIKDVRSDEIIFYLPQMKTIGDFKLDRTESRVRDLDVAGRMFGSETLTIKISNLDQMVEADGFSGHMTHKPRVIAVFR